MQNIGVSLALGLLCGEPETAAQRSLLGNGCISELLSGMKSEGVSSIEIRTVTKNTEIEKVATAAASIHSAGLNITVHSELPPGDPAAFFAQLQPVIALQGQCTVTVHPFKGGAKDADNMRTTVAALRRISEYIINHKNVPIIIALENNRITGLDDVTHSPVGVLSALESVNYPQIRACWDFGHLYSDNRLFGAPEMPPSGFITQTAHTHIHSLNGRTHFPLNRGELPLEAYVSALRSVGYSGVYNLELEPERWPNYWGSPLPYYISSIRMLKLFLHQ